MIRSARTGTTPMMLLAAISIVTGGASGRGLVAAQDTAVPSAAHDPRVGENGVEILTPTPGVNLNRYVYKMLIDVRTNWNAVMPTAALAGEKGKTTVEFQIQADGKVEDISVAGSSGNDLFDQAAVKGIRNSSPLDPLPRGFTGPYIRLRISFLYNMSPHAAQSASPFDCNALKAPERPQAPPYDRLELVAFLLGQTSWQYAGQIVCQRGIDFAPDSSFLDTLRSFAVPSNLLDSIGKLTPQTIRQPSPTRVSAYGFLEMAIADKRGVREAPVGEDYERALRLADDSAALHLAYSMSLLSGRRYPEAELQARRSLELWPQDAEAHVALAMALSGQERDEEAVPEAREALRIFPNHKAALVELGLSLARSRQYKEAVPVLQEAASRAAEVPTVHKFLGISLLYTGNLDSAIGELALFLKANPEDAQAHYFLGVALRSTHKQDEALAQFREAARIEPTNPLYSAVVDPSDPEKAGDDGSKPAGPRPDDCFYSGNVYTNTYFGFSYEYPKGWNVLSADASKALVRFGSSMLANGDPAAPDYIEVGSENSYALLGVTQSAVKGLATRVNVIQIQALDLRVAPDLKSGEDMLKSITKLLQQRGLPISIVKPPESFEIGGRTFWSTKLNIKANNDIVHETDAATIEKNYLLLFVFAAHDDSKLDELVGTMQSLRFMDSPR
ncbi:MAG: TonB family protein [Candidatus Acidiferrales bacterium]